MTRASWCGCLALVATLALASPAFAERGVHGPRNGLALDVRVQPPAELFVSYERFLLPPRLSVVAAPGFAGAGSMDYTFFHILFFAEARYWLIGRAPFDRLGDGAMVGPFAAARLDLDWTPVTEEDLGWTRHIFRLGESLHAGYRLTFGGAFAVTATLGAGFRHDFGAMAELESEGADRAVLGKDRDPRWAGIDLGQGTHFGPTTSVTLGAVF